MAPLPAVVDPNLKRDKLPQPYRLIDKLLAEVLESSFAEIADLEAERTWQAQWEYGTAFQEDGLLLQSQQATCCCVTPDGKRLVSGTKDGRVVVTLLATKQQEAELKLFEKPVTSVAAYNTPTILQADQEAGRSVLQVCACDRLGLAVLYLKNPSKDGNSKNSSEETPGLVELAKAAVPSGRGTQAVSAQVSISPDGKHVVFTGGSGAAALYNMPPDPREPVSEPLEPLLWLTEQFSREILDVVDETQLGGCNALWQLTDAAKPGRNKAAKGVYLWWRNYNQLLLLPLTQQPTLCVQSLQEDSPPITDTTLKKVGSWVAPAQMTAVSATVDGSTLALGLCDGSVILYSNATQSPVAVVASTHRDYPVASLAFLPARPGYPGGQLLVGTKKPNLRALNLLDLNSSPEPVLMQDSVFSIQPILHAPLALLLLGNKRTVVFNATEMCVEAELKLQASGYTLDASCKSCSFRLPPKDEEGNYIPGAELEEVKHEELGAQAFMFAPGPTSTVFAVGISETAQDPGSQETQGGTPGGRAEDNMKDDGAHEPEAEAAAPEETQDAEPNPSDPADAPDPIDDDDPSADSSNAKGGDKGGKKTPATADAAEIKEVPKRFVYTAAVGGIAIFNLQDVNSSLKPEEEDVLGGKPLMIDRMLKDLEHHPALGLMNNEATMRHDSPGKSAHAHFMRGVTPNKSNRGGSREGAGSIDLATTKKPANIHGSSRDYEPSDAGTGLSGVSGDAGGEGVGVRVARPVPGASAGVAERVLGKLGDAGGRRTRNRIMRKHMKELSGRLMADEVGPMYLAPATPTK